MDQPPPTAPTTFAECYRDLRPEMVRLATLMTGSPETAQDLVQDAFVRLHVVQDSDALTGVMEEIHNGSFAQQVRDASAKVTEVVFTSPTEAAVRYDINVANYSIFTGRIGRALLIDGVWKVARVTVCADISLAGGNCPNP